MVQVKSTVTSINPNTLRPIFHRFLSPRQRTMNIAELYKLGVPAYVCSTLDKVLLIPSVSVATYIHRMVPLEPTMPKVIGIPYGMLCIARENVEGGDIVTNEPQFIEPRSGDLIIFPSQPQLQTHTNSQLEKKQNEITYYMRPLQPIQTSQDAYMDVIWFMQNII